MTDTYDRRVQLGASRRRLEDAQALHSQKRWAGAMYLGGYAIECSLKSLICYEEEKNNFKDTQVFKKGLQGSELHNLIRLLDCLSSLQSTIQLDRSNGYREAWNTISSLWQNEQLRYSKNVGDEVDSQKFLNAVKKIHRFLLEKQDES